MAAGNKNLNSAKTARKDEFYTQLTDIEKEMRYYRKHFKDKIVLCNCDDPFESNFFKYFVLNFNRLGLKKLIATCYTGSPIANKQLSIFDILGASEETQNKPYKAVVTTVYDKTGDGGVDMLDVAELFKLFGDSTRMKILYALFESELCVCHMAQLLGLTQSAVSHQLRILKGGRLVKPRREGKTVYYSLADDHVRKIIAQGMEHIME